MPLIFYIVAIPSLIAFFVVGFHKRSIWLLMPAAGILSFVATIFAVIYIFATTSQAWPWLILAVIFDGLPCFALAFGACMAAVALGVAFRKATDKSIDKPSIDTSETKESSPETE